MKIEYENLIKEFNENFKSINHLIYLNQTKNIILSLLLRHQGGFNFFQQILISFTKIDSYQI